ncbi:MAG: O-antigen ligase family protein [Chloroflexota bacterium]|nr:O-antigen ligase family protein [Chloroflexota bacterium]
MIGKSLPNVQIAHLKVGITTILLGIGLGVLVSHYGVLAFGAVMLLGLLTLMFVRPRAVTLVILFVLYANLAVVAKSHYGVPQPIAASFFLLLGLPLLNYLFVHRQKIVVNRVFLLMVVYLAVLLVSAAASEDVGRSVGRIVAYVTEGLVLYFLILNTVRSPSLLRQGIWALILAGCLMGSVSLYQEVTSAYDNDFGGLAIAKASEIDTGEEDILGEDIKRRRLAGPIGSKNRYAQVMVVLLPLALLRVWADRSWALRILAALACIPILSGALLTFSRGAGIAVIATLLAMALLRTINPRHFFLLAFVGSLVVVAAVPDYAYRISTVVDVAELVSGNAAEAGGSVRGRATVNLAAFHIFLDHPILGVGPGQTNRYTAEYGNEVGYRRLETTRRAHNMYLEELADSGLLGFTMFISIVGLTMYQLMQLHRRFAASRPDVAYTAAGLLFALIAYLITGMFLHLSYVRYYWLLLALAGAAVHIFDSQTETQAHLNATHVQGSRALNQGAL